MRSYILSACILIGATLTCACNRPATSAGGATPDSTAAGAADSAAGASTSAGKTATAEKTARAEAPAPAWREVTLPAGTRLPIVLDTAVGSAISRVEQPVEAHLSEAVSVGDETVLREGSQVTGVVTAARRAGKVKGRAHVAVRFDALVPHGPGVADERYAIKASAVARTAAATKKKDAFEIGGPAAGGALVGALLGGKKGALVGTAVGGGAGTAVVMSTRGKDVQIGRGAALTLQLSEPVTIRVRAGR